MRDEIKPYDKQRGFFGLIGKRVCSVVYSGCCPQVGQRFAQIDRLGLGTLGLFRYQYFSLPVMGDSHYPELLGDT